MEFLAYLQSEWSVISQAPLIFITGLILSAAIVSMVMRYWFSDRIATLEGRLKLRDDQLDEYKGKLGGASAEEAKQRLDELERRVEALAPRRMTKEQIGQLSAILAANPAHIEIAHDMVAGDLRGFVGDIATAFKQANWSVNLPMVMGIGNHPPSGIALQVQDVGSLRPIELQVANSLNSIGIEFDVFSARPVTAMYEGRPGPDVGLLITSRLV